jgi:hypothetical protein
LQPVRETMAEFFAGIGGFFSSAVGGIAVGAVFVWPAHCQRLVDVPTEVVNG